MIRVARVRVLVVRAAGINCEQETLHGWRLAGAQADLVHVRQLIEAPAMLNGVQVLTIPGGFSYGDDIAAGRILAAKFQRSLLDLLHEFVAAEKILLGICNGFQVLVQMGLLPGGDLGSGRVSLATNGSGRYEDRWVILKISVSRCPFLKEGTQFELPVGHGEGRLVVDDEKTLVSLHKNGHVALQYVGNDNGSAAYPANPNGSADDIAGLVDDTGRVLGLMPHPDRFLHHTQHPLWTRRSSDARPDGLTLFRSAVESLA